MESSLKQRLIGAAVLVALAVIFLPMLLDGPAPEPGTEAVTLDIPAAPGRDFETRVLPLQPPPPAAAADGTVTVAPDAVVTVDANAPLRPDALPEADGGDAPASPPATVAAEPAPTPVAATPAPASATESVPAPAPQPPPPAQRGGRYLVNLGSFGNIGNAQALLQRLKAAGVAAYSESIQIDGKPALRLRAGPFAGRGDAEAARLAAQRLEPGLSASVTTQDAAVPAPANARSGFALQVGAFRDRADADALRARLAGGGLAAFIDEVTTDAGRLYRVRIGPETQRSRAEALQATVKQRFQLDGLVVTHP